MLKKLRLGFFLITLMMIATCKTTVEAPKEETSKATSKATPKETAKETPKATAKETPKATPKETAKETPEETFFVTSENGLNIRDKPDSKGRIIVAMPFGSQVRSIRGSSQKETIGGHAGAWINVSWQGKTGFAFDQYLCSPADYYRMLAKLRGDCPPFMIRRVICYPREGFLKLARKFKGWPTNGEIPLPMFDPLPHIVPGSGISVITRDAVIPTSVRSLRMSRIGCSTVTDGSVNVALPPPENCGRIVFTLGKKYENAVYLDRTDLILNGAKEPELLSLSKSAVNAREQELLGLYLRSYKIVIDNFKISRDPVEIRKFFDISLQEAKHPALPWRLEVMQFRKKNRAERYFDYINIYVDGAPVSGGWEEIFALFLYRDTLYASVNGWLPAASLNYVALYEIRKGMMKTLLRSDSDDSTW